MFYAAIAGLPSAFLLSESSVMTEAATESLLNNEYTQELKDGASYAWSTLFSSKFFYAIILIVIMLILFKITDMITGLIRRHDSSPMSAFMGGVVKALVAVVVILRILKLFDWLSGLTEQILMSSSLLVVVLGFVFQEGLTNIIHGFIISISKPFQIGDRVTVTIDGVTLTGYVNTMGLRATVIQNVENNALVSVPNSKLDLGLIQNNYLDTHKSSTGFLDLMVTYESDLDRTISLVEQIIQEDPAVEKERIRTGTVTPPPVLVRSFGDSGINIRGIVTTHTVEENFAACSRIRKAIKEAFDRDESVDFAYPHVYLMTDGGQMKKVPGRVLETVSEDRKEKAPAGGMEGFAEGFSGEFPERQEAGSSGKKAGKASAEVQDGKNTEVI